MYSKLVLTPFWPKVVSWRFEITTDEFRDFSLFFEVTAFRYRPVELRGHPSLWNNLNLKAIKASNIEGF